MHTKAWATNIYLCSICTHIPLACRDTCTFFWNLMKFVAENTWLNHSRARLILSTDWAAMHEAYICMSVHTYIYKTHNQWWSAGVWENVRKQQLLLLHVSGDCADVWAKELKQATAHMLSCQCCGSAHGLWLTSVRRVDRAWREWDAAITKISPDQKSTGDAVHKKLSFDKPSVATWPEALNLSTVILSRIYRLRIP